MEGACGRARHPLSGCCPMQGCGAHPAHVEERLASRERGLNVVLRFQVSTFYFCRVSMRVSRVGLRQYTALLCTRGRSSCRVCHGPFADLCVCACLASRVTVLDASCRLLAIRAALHATVSYHSTQQHTRATRAKGRGYMYGGPAAVHSYDMLSFM